MVMILLVPSANIRQVCHMSRHFIRPEDMFVVGGFILLCGMSLGKCTQIYKFCMWYDFLMVWYVFTHSFLLTPFRCLSLNRLFIAHASNILFSLPLFLLLLYSSLYLFAVALHCFCCVCCEYYYWRGFGIVILYRCCEWHAEAETRLSDLNVTNVIKTDPDGQAVAGVALQHLDCWNCGFQCR
jgi:hypothetical protein